MTTCIRRKPIITYQSPSPNDSAFLPRAYGQTHVLSRSFSEPMNVQQSTFRSSAQQMSRRNNYSTATNSLPLFHPLGHLATILPLFDPRPYGLPLLPKPWTTTSFSSPKQGKVVGNQREISRNPSFELATATPIGEVNRLELKVKATPHKSRKRKRMEAEHNTTYPAKKARVPRGTSSHGANEDLPIDQTSLRNDTGAVAGHLSLEAGERAQTGVKRDPEQLASHMSEEVPSAVVKGPTSSVAAMDKGEVPNNGAATRVHPHYTGGEEDKEEKERIE